MNCDKVQKGRIVIKNILHVYSTTDTFPGKVIKVNFLLFSVGSYCGHWQKVPSQCSKLNVLSITITGIVSVAR